MVVIKIITWYYFILHPTFAQILSISGTEFGKPGDCLFTQFSCCENNHAEVFSFCFFYTISTLQ